ncbi:hypothetical protein [Polynucleobacter bastaniensis]|uniref:hypothetical protein n=1 Tax=Polynucleobacter bastaniensis TaxID=2081039 RepID=UPI001C0B4CD0|nr:hypothetical protein [Polynucleobacter bastaniensis]MBU3598561.1 hypothetical protein [Polynucleobacter bastaniensis]
MTRTKESPIQQAPITIVEDATPRINLATSDDVRREMAKVYRESRVGKIATSEATRLVYMLTQILKAHEVYVLEQKLLALELAHLEVNR